MVDVHSVAPFMNILARGFLTFAVACAVALPAAAQDGPTPVTVEPQGPTPSSNASASAQVGEGLQFGRKQLKALFGGLAGIPMWALVGCSVLTVTFVLERLVVLQARRVAPKVFTSRFLKRLREEELDDANVRELVKICRDHHSPIAQFFAIVVENHGRSSFEIRTAVTDVADSELFHLRKHIRAIAGLATLAPLLGLFGTVIGMIDAFHALSQQAGAGKTELLAAGISLALVATASGLGVAIVASVMYYFLQGKVDQRIQELDVLTNQAISLVASDGRIEFDRKRRRPAEEPKAKEPVARPEPARRS